MAIIREMGANTIRLTHYQHGQAIHDLADRYGLILWDEIPFVSVMTLAADQVEPTPGLVADAASSSRS
jgi:beta-galactosidase